jgi:RNA polymerase sigma factor (sigma-70 family)
MNKGGRGMNNLIDIVKKARKGEKEAMIELLEKFKPLIKKYSYKLNYEDSEAELVLFLLEIVHSMEIENGSYINDECVIGYINKCFINKFYKLSNSRYMKSIIETCLEIEISNEEDYLDIETNIYVNELLGKLTNRQRMIVHSIYIDNKQQKQIAKEFHISRQAIHRTKRRAFEILKNEMEFMG